jgi:hypothetical protein
MTNPKVLLNLSTSITLSSSYLSNLLDNKDNLIVSSESKVIYHLNNFSKCGDIGITETKYPSFLFKATNILLSLLITNPPKASLFLSIVNHYGLLLKLTCSPYLIYSKLI